MARLHQLPIEVRARICEFIGNIADAPSDYQPDPRGLDNFFPTDSWLSPTYSSIYRDLRSLALTSKAFTDSAQRVLFRIAVVKAGVSLGESYGADGLDDPSDDFLMGFSLDECTSNTFPQLKSLTLNYNALQDRVDSIAARPRYLYPVGCPPNIERLTLAGYWSSKVPSINYIHSWIRSNTSLKELRVVNGFDDRLCAFDRLGALYADSTTRKRIVNWNTILPLFKDTLELLVFDGYKSIHEDSEVRFGPTRMLSCLGEFEKLAYLKVPLHMLRQDCPKLCVPKTGQHVLDLVQAKLPKGLKKVDIVVFGRGELAENTNEWEQNWITPIETFQVRL
ncbi:hypothetical protein NCU17041 [Neurospora crassa OR74A]|uniref:Uncharacterized protein n=1 Tax=Neurospora crassa (strain ATCC 24698 / 74-OR23-1A / CBS 708.71 / DSM 1257 / FGSC 987) TaxID=367110 RepID=V5IMV6_NEUCR|nr:hypothetical protein NCU17041 [Neurospora crassa OR74A]ESA42720.1 hypothetical protein NCU17041 [Neurospora crassa OR74A]|eukprot:XP_011394855.1 hypothetical protein NCU17041 [Neurospora crassa OR74A]